MAIVEGAFQQKFRTSVGISVPVLDPREPPRVPRGPTMDPTVPERPASALARGVTITEFKEAKVNPEPVPLEESEYLLEEYLSPRKLRDLTGIEDLDDVKYLEMKVDTQDTSLGNFGIHLPNLKQLKLSNSIITSVRDLGSSLNNLRVLWMARCGMEDLDGLSSMSNLQELYLAYNDLYDISPCSMLENIEILDLEGNNIDELSQIHFLNSCVNLKNLTLEGNPVCVTPSPDEANPQYDYRKEVKEAIPNLELLDDEPITDTDDNPRRRASVFEDDWALIDEMMQDGTVAGSEDSITSAGITTARPPTSSLRPTTSYRPDTSSRAYTGTGIRPGSRSGRPPTGERPFTSSRRPGTGSRRPGSGRSGGRPDSAGRPNSGEHFESTEDVSDLTCGAVVCGNPSKALRSRHKNNRTQNQSTAKIMQQLKFVPEHTYDTVLEDDLSMKDLLNDLRQWKAVHTEKQDEIDARKAPQVLRISHDDAISLSDDESVESDDDVDDEDHKALISAYSEDHLRRLTDVRPKSRSLRDPSPRSKQKSNRARYDESFDAPDEGINVHTPEEESLRSPYRYSSHNKSHSSSEVRSLSPVRLHDDDIRPVSNPLPATKPKLRLDGPVDKTKPKLIDRFNPVIRALPHSPENRVFEGIRVPPDSAKAALTHLAPVAPPSRMRKQLANVQLLPSKYGK